MNSNINHTERSHALLSASGSKRWLACPRSALFSLDFPSPPSSKYAEEGTHAHELAEHILKGLPVHKKTDADMLANVRVYTDYVLRQSQGKSLSIEESGNLIWINSELSKGTADAVIRGDWDIEVIDLKYGAGVPVSPEENTQLMMYALMAVYNPKMNSLDETYETVTLTIVQPRCGEEKIRSWVTSVDRLKEFAEEIRKGAALATTKDAPLSSGDHCKWCPCAHGCPELKRITHEVIAKEFDVLPQVERLTDAQIMNVVKHESTINNFIEACKEYATMKLAKGQVIEGLKLVRGRGSRDWKFSEEEIEQKLLEVTSPDEIYLSGLKSIAQIEKIIGKKAMEPLTVKKEGKITITTKEDRRPEVTDLVINDFEVYGQINLLD